MTPEASSQPPDAARADAIAACALLEAQFLAGQRIGALRSPELTRSELAPFDERLAPQVDLLVVRGGAAIEWLLALLPAAETAGDACAIGLVLLESPEARATEGLLAVLAAAEAEPVVHGLQAALRRGRIERVLPRLKEWFDSASSRQAAAAAEALAFHRKLDKNSPRLAALLDDADPLVRRAAWRAAALTG